MFCMGLSLRTLRFRFGLRGLLVAVTLVALLLATLGVHVERSVRRDRVVHEIIDRGGWVYFDYQAPALSSTSPLSRRSVGSSVSWAVT